LVGLALFIQKASPPEEDLNAGSPSVLCSEVLGIMDLGASWRRGFLFSLCQYIKKIKSRSSLVQIKIEAGISKFLLLPPQKNTNF
jgi:hypothetical protein